MPWNRGHRLNVTRLFVPSRGLLTMPFSRLVTGRGQPLPLALPFGEIPWFDVRSKIRRYDWLNKSHYSLEIHAGLKKSHSLEKHAGHIQKASFWPIIAMYFTPNIKPRNFAKRQCERQWLTPITSLPLFHTKEQTTDCEQWQISTSLYTTENAAD